MAVYCDQCFQNFGEREPKIHLDGKKFHDNCVKQYLKERGKPIFQALQSGVETMKKPANG